MRTLDEYKLMSTLDECVVLIDKKGLVVQASHSMLEMIHLKQEAINGKPLKNWLAFSSETNRATYQDFLDGNTESDLVELHQMSVKDVEGNLIPVRVRIVKNESGFTVVCRDLSLPTHLQAISFIEDQLEEDFSRITKSNMIINIVNFLSEITHSEFAYLFLRPVDSSSRPQTFFSDKVFLKYPIPQLPDNFSIESAGLWVQPLVKSGRVVLNEIEKDTFYIFNEIITLNRLMALPININEKVVGVIGVANKTAEYSSDDVAGVSAVAHRFSKMLEFYDLKESYRSVSKKLQQTEVKMLSLSNKLLLTEEKLEQTKKELDEAQLNAESDKKVKTALLNNLSQEIRSPMNAIVGFSDMLSQEKVEEREREEFIKIIDSSSKRMLEIVNNIMDFSKLKSGSLEIISREHSLNKLMMDVYLMNYPIVKSKLRQRVKFEYKTFLPDGEDIVLMDDSRVKQILDNIITNAIKNTGTGKIHFSYELKGNAYIQFSVSDTGTGIPKKQAAELFMQKEIDPKNIGSQQGGMGLGLLLSKGLVELMGGKIWFDTKLKKGTTFYFTIPYEPAATPSLSNVIRNIDIKEKLAGKKILIVDDEPMSYQLLKRMLSVTGVDVIHAVNGLEGVEMVKATTNIDLVLMDLRMPVMDGFTATREIKKINSVIPVVAQTAFSMYEEEQKAREAGCDDFITKPISKESLLLTVMEHIFK
jgi:signal transduction histidine kinase/CheY-like chemotaxis protein